LADAGCGGLCTRRGARNTLQKCASGNFLFGITFTFLVALILFTPRQDNTPQPVQLGYDLTATLVGIIYDQAHREETGLGVHIAWPDLQAHDRV